jgi:hypothetical protein
MEEIVSELNAVMRQDRKSEFSHFLPAVDIR